MQSTTEVFGIPKKSNPPRSRIYLSTGNGFGSIGIYIRRFLVVAEKYGNAMTYLDDPAQGACIIINTPGIYTITISDNTSTNLSYCVCKNLSAAERAADPGALLTANDPRILGWADSNGAQSVTVPVTVTAVLQAGDRIYHCGAGGAANSDRARLIITQVSN